MKSRTVQTLANWAPAVAGWIAALLMVAWLAPYPPQARTIEQVLFLYASAIAHVLLVAAAAALASIAVWVFVRKKAQRLTWGIASRAAWVVPLFIFSFVGSFWAVVVAVLATLGCIHVFRNLQPAAQQNPALSSNARIIGCILAGAAIEVGLIAFGTRRLLPAIALFGLATLIIAWQATKAGKHGHPARGLITMFLAILFSCGGMVWRTGVRDGDGFLGFPVDPAISVSLYTLQKTFGSGQPAYVPKREAAPKDGDANVNVAGLAHQGIFLWPEVKKETTLVPPLPSLGRRVFGKDHRTPLTIPFYGAYWFFRLPYTRPPMGSMVIHGSPILRQFLSNDNSPLSEEAHQNLQTSFDLSCCKAIEVDVTNADQQAELIDVELALMDSTQWSAHARQSLGRKPLLTKPISGAAVPETLSYAVPPKDPKFSKMDELVVRFRLVQPRWAESAQVAIERFRLIPR